MDNDDDEIKENPFARPGPTEFEKHLYEVQEAHGTILMTLHTRIMFLENLLKEQQKLLEAQNKAAFAMPETDKEKAH